MAASTSTSDVYDVFINHRGPDVKKTLASHLYYRLISHNLRVFLDYHELEQGENFDCHITGAIASSSVHVAIFSPTYAQSKWCLDELQLMLESKSPIIPVFYKVQPVDLRWTHEQDKGVYDTALHNHEKKIQFDGQPREAGISGFELEAFNGDEGALLNKVVECVWKKIKKPQLNVAKYPTGLEEKTQDFERTVLSRQRSGRVQVVGISGMGGVGKTTLAKELFNRKSSNYSKSYFLSDVRENVAKSSLHYLQSKVLIGLLSLDKVRIHSVPEGIEMLKKHLSSLQILLVLDDVDNVDQVEALLPVNVLLPDSFILITSRNKNVLASSGIPASSIYQLTGLDEHHSRELFCSYAFCQPHPLSGFEYLVDQFLEAGNGLPLFLKVFGGLLSSRNKSYWEDELKKLQQTIHKDIKESLQISYNALDDDEKQIFLDIACFFIGEKRDIATEIWNGSGWPGSLGFQKLQEMSLVELNSDNTIKMHDLLRDLGRDLAKHPELPRRLWRGIGDIDGLMQYSSGKTDVRGIRVSLTEDYADAELIHHMILNEDEDEHSGEDDDEDEEDYLNHWYDSRELQRRKLLKGKFQKLLQLNEVKVTKLQLLDVDILPEHIMTGVQSPNLIWLRWRACHHSSLPTWIPVKNLWVLELRGKKLKTLWQTRSQVPQQLRELRIFAPLSNIPKSIGKLKHLERIVVNCAPFYDRNIPKSIGKLKHLERIVVDCYDSFEELPEEFGRLLSLKVLVLNRCLKMRCLPDSFGNLTKLEHIDLSGCMNLERFPNSFRKLTRLKYLNLSECSDLTISRDTLGNISTLEYINLDYCHNIGVLPSQFAHQRNLKKLNLNHVLLEELPSDIGELSALEALAIESYPLATLPPSIGDLSNLKQLKVDCRALKELPNDIGKLSALEELVIKVSGLKELPHSIGNLSNLKTLKVDQLKLPDSIRPLNQLSQLIVTHCSWPELPFKKSLAGESEKYCMPRLLHLKLFNTKILDKVSFEEGVCPNLQHLIIQSCNGLPGVGTLPNALVKLELTGCRQLRKIEGLRGLTKLQELDIEDCIEVEDLSDFETLASLEVLRAHKCVKLKNIRGSAELTKLRRVDISDCSDLEELQGFENLRSLEVLQASGCVKLKRLPGLAQLTELRALEVSGCSDLEELPGFENLMPLEELDVSRCVKLKSIPGLAQLTELRTLIVYGCSDLEGLPGVENLRLLKYLDVTECGRLKSIPGLAQLTVLRTLVVHGCSDLEELQGVENLRSLENLDASVCVKLKSIPGLAQLTKLRTLEVYGGSDLEELQGVEKLRSLEKLDVSGCVKLKSIQGLAQLTDLRTLQVSGCSDLEELQGVEKLRSLAELDVSGCAKLKIIPGLCEAEEHTGVGAADRASSTNGFWLL